jgi:site-specific DNA-methyltransferase (adenine-specific)/adenine-specific DNA-methyltransferase
VLPDAASRSKLHEHTSAIFTEKYDDFLRLGIEEWKKSYADHEPLGKKAVLFVMVDDTKNCDDVGAYLERICPELAGAVLVIHTKKNGEISEAASGKTIPPEVFDKKAVEKGQVRFSEVSFIEAQPRFDAKNPLRVAVELTDFSVYYSQGIADAIAAELKEGKSEVVCDQGKLIKLTKDKKGIVTPTVLTKHWTDWVDYWAVDFHYESRKEIIRVPIEKDAEPTLALPGAEKTAQPADAKRTKEKQVFLADEFEYEDQWTGAYIFENEWQSFRTKKDRKLELTSITHTYEKQGHYVIAVKVIDIFGNDTMTLVAVNVH